MFMDNTYEDVTSDILPFIPISHLYKLHLLSKNINYFLHKHEDYFWFQILSYHHFSILSSNNYITSRYKNYTISCPSIYSFKNIYISNFHPKMQQLKKDAESQR